MRSRNIRGGTADRLTVHPNRAHAAILVGLVLLTLLVMWPNLKSSAIDDLDSAHHLMDGYFFRDVLHDLPLHGFKAYALAYYKQYPALGFLFWPPLIPLVYGLFCSVAGVHVLTVRACMFCFGLAFAYFFFKLLRRQASTVLSVVGVVVVTTVPGMVWSFNEIMLEMPTLALMFGATLTYFNFVEKLNQPGRYMRAVFCGLMCGALIYSKQPSWFLLCALLVDYLVVRREAGAYREVLLAAVVTVVVDIPLAVFTLVFGKANLGQSVGSSTNRIMQQYQSLPRWSAAAWTYYPKLALARLDVVVVVAVVVGLLLAFTQRQFLRRNLVWFSWFVLAYLTFSYYDNRSPRHATFWWPAWVAIAVSAAQVLQRRLPHRVQWTLPALLLLPVPFHLVSAWHTNYSDYTGVQQSIAQLFNAGNPGTTLMIGSDKQVLTAVIREHDTQRVTHVLRGERLLEADPNINTVCYDYRVATVLVEEGSAQPPMNAALHSSSTLREVSRSSFLRRGQPVTLIAYRYSGPMAATAHEISLSNALTQ